MADKYDDVLLSVFKEAKTFPTFIDIIFGFLHRRTDFYHVSTEPNLDVGLPEGVAQSLLLDMYNKYAQKEVQIENPIKEEAIMTEAVNITNDKTVARKSKPARWNCYNGAAYGNYSWSQTMTDIDIEVIIAEKLTSRQVCVEVTPTMICVKSKNPNMIYLEGNLSRKCKAHETIWSLAGHILQIHLEKAPECWWDCLFQWEPKLDFKQMDCSRPFHELSDEAQVKIEELNWIQERKRKGLPTTDKYDLSKTFMKP